MAAAPKLEKIERKGFPQFLIIVVNTIIGLLNRPWTVQYKTDSADYKAEVVQDADKVTILLPRNPGGTSGGSTTENVIIVKNGVAGIYTISATFVGPA